jgi:heptosyltransferase-2
LSIIRKTKPPMQHVVERYLDALRTAGVRISDAGPAMYPGADDIEWAGDFLKAAGYSGGLLVGMAPGAKRKTKMWPASKYAELANRLIRDRGASVVMVGDGGDAAAGKEVLESARVIDGIGKTDIGKLAALVSRCSLLISNDSAPTHVAVAVKTPVVTIFGPTIEEFGFAPYGHGNATVSRELHCRPCSLHGTEECPESHFRCMNEIDADTVYRAVEKLPKT